MYTYLVILLTALLPLPAYAGGLADVGAAMVTGMWIDVCTLLPYCGMGATGVGVITGIIVRTVLWIIGSSAILIILYAAVRIVSSAGNEETISKGKKVIFYAALGLLFAVLASTIVNYVFGLVSDIAA